MLDLEKKMYETHPHWGVEDWEVFWCKQGKKQMTCQEWLGLKKCDHCNCERKDK